MIVRIEYEALKGSNTLVMHEKSKNVYPLLRVRVSDENIESALAKKFKNRVIGYDFIGNNFDKIRSLNPVNKLILIEKDCTSEFPDNIEDYVSGIPSCCRVVLRVAQDFHDMRFVKALSERFSNVSFCGGDFLRLDGCRLGCVQVSDLQGKGVSIKSLRTCGGCNCAMKTVDASDVEFDLLSVAVLACAEKSTSSEKKGASKSGKKSAEKKKSAFLSSGGLSAF